MRYKSIQYFVGRPFGDQNNKIIKNCIRLKMENKTVRLPGDRCFIFLQIAKKETTMGAKIYSILETYLETFVLLLMDERFNLSREIGIMVQINNSI